MHDVKDTLTQDKVVALSVKFNLKDPSAMYLIINHTMCEVMVTFVVVDMDVAETREIDPNQEIEMVTASIETDSISLSSVQHLEMNVTNATS